METLTVPLGPNCSIDGGKYSDCHAVASGNSPSDTPGAFTFEDQNGERFVENVDEVEEAIAAEMRSGEPIRLSTGDVGDGHCIGKIEIPLVEGFSVNLHQLPGQGHDTEARLENLRDDDLRRESFERKIATYGGSIETIN